MYVGCDEPLKVSGPEFCGEGVVEREGFGSDGISEKGSPVSGNGEGLVPRPLSYRRKYVRKVVPGSDVEGDRCVKL